MSSFQHIFLDGSGAAGSLSVSSSGLHFKDSAGQVKRSVPGDQLLRAFVQVYGNKGQLQAVLKDGKTVLLDGFDKEDVARVQKQVETQYSISCEKSEVACDGGNFGDVVLNDSSLQMNSAKTGKPSLELRLLNVSQCVLPGNNKDEVEIQFYDNDEENQEEDCLVQIRMRFPGADEDDEETPAEIFQKRIMERGMIHSVTGDVIADFTEEQGTFITPRGRYAIQMYSTFLRMHGSKYDYKITYDDIGTIYLLHRPDEISSCIVISLEKPIRQGNQKYPYLVLQSNRLEHTMEINLSEEEIAEKYDGKLMPEMTMAMDSLVATVFKVLAQSKVLITRNFKSDQNHDCIKCSLKQNDGLLYPFEKSIIFIHKPTVIIRYSDVESVEYGRYKTDKHSATKNFDLKLILKSNVQSSYGDVKEFEFAGIERQEFANIHTFLKSKKMNVEEVEVAKKSLVDELGADIPEDSDEEDDDYNSDNASQSSGGSGGSSDSESYASSNGGSDSGRRSKGSKVLKKRKKEVKVSKKSKSSSKKAAASPKKKKKKKDKDAPKGAVSAYILYGSDIRNVIKEEKPDITASDIMKEIGVRWKLLTAEEKAIFEEKAAADKMRYKDEMAAYKSKKAAEGGDDDDSDSEEETPKKKKRKKDKNAPKGATSAYIAFGSSIRNIIKEENPDITPKEIMKEIGVRWKAMSSEDKAPFEEKAAADKVRYKEEMTAYKNKVKEESADEKSSSAEDDDESGSDGGSMSEGD